MDRHEFVGLSAEEAALAHVRDLKIQGRYGVRFLTYWFDEVRQTAFCLAKHPVPMRSSRFIAHRTATWRIKSSRSTSPR